jgi:hypothetical protein
VEGVGQWFSIEVLDGTYSAAGWADAFGDSLVTEAVSRGASNWDWHHHTWGTVFEVEFEDEDVFTRFRAAPAVQAALDAVPDPTSGLIIYRGRGGSSGAGEPRRIRPLIGSGAAALPLPLSDDEWMPQPEPPRRLLGVND